MWSRPTKSFWYENRQHTVRQITCQCFIKTMYLVQPSGILLLHFTLTQKTLWKFIFTKVKFSPFRWLYDTDDYSNDMQPVVLYSCLILCLPYRDISNVNFPRSRSFRPLRVVIGHADRWVRLSAWCWPMPKMHRFCPVGMGQRDRRTDIRAYRSIA